MKTSEIPIWNEPIPVEGGWVICTVEVEPGVFRLRRVPQDFVGAIGAQGLSGRSAGLHYQYSTNVIEADPGFGFLRLNNTNLLSATELYISEVDEDGNVAGLIFLLDFSTSVTRSTLIMRKKSNPAVFAAWSVVGAGVDNGQWKKLPITAVSSSGGFSNNDEVTFEFSLTGSIGPVGATGSTGAAGTNGTDGRNAGIKYIYDTTTTATDPGSGRLQFNNVNLALATSLFVSETDGDANALQVYLATWDDSTSTIRGFLMMRKDTDPSVFAIFSITGTLTDNGAWDTFTVAHIISNGSFSDNDVVKIHFFRTGDKGDTGATGPQGSTGTIDWPYYIERAIDFYSGGSTQRGQTWASTASSANSLAATDDHPEGRDLRTSTTLNNSAFYETNTTSMRFLKLNTKMVFQLNLVHNTGIRSWVGCAAGTGATMFGSTDTPAVNFVGFRFSTSVPDTNIQVVIYDGVTLTVVDTGVAPSLTTMQTLRIEWERNGSEVRFYVENVLKHTANTNLPAAGTDLRPMAGVKNLVGGAGTDRHLNTYSFRYREGITIP